MQTKNVPLDDLRNAVGEANIREATPEDSVDGVAASYVIEPGSTEEISEVMQVAARENLAVAPRGAGTKMHIGDPPAALDLLVSTARMNEVIEHVPGDQIVRLQSGVKLSTVLDQVGGSNQLLALDPPETKAGATIGGVIATNSSGPLRLRYGTVRDLIIGITVVLHDGTVAKAGGKVVKNVAGYDLSKLFTGSFGTLGIIATANFRLHPIPEVARTVSVEVSSAQDAGGAAAAIMGSQIAPSACELRWDDERKSVSTLVESIPGGIEAKVETASFLLKPFGEVSVSEEVGLPTMPEDDVLLKLTAPPAELTGVLESVSGAAERKGVGARLSGHAATGVTFAGLSGESEAIAEVVEELREIRTRRGGSVVIQKAPVDLKWKVGVWGPGGDSINLMRRVKDKFDPRGGLNPGRFIGGI